MTECLKGKSVTTAYVLDDRFNAHTMNGHPEYAGRLEAVARRFRQLGLDNQLHQIAAVHAPREAVAAVHSESYLTRLSRTSALSDTVMFGLDTYVTPQSYATAQLAAGGVLEAVRAVMQGDVDNALASVRPPGHHARPAEGMGFCLLNNIAIAARYGTAVLGLDRVLIVDFDVHHGNGTQDIFYADPSVLFISSHQSPLYPGTGALYEMGEDAGEGFTINVPLPPGVGDAGYRSVYEEIVVAAARRFAPQLILVSAGYDAHWADPLANMRLSLTGYADLSRILIDLAAELCRGRIVFVLEGGYNLHALAHGWANLAHALMGHDRFADPLGPARDNGPDVARVIEQVRALHSLP